MLPSKSKSGLSDTPINKTTPATPRVSKLSRAGSTRSDSALPSPVQKRRLSVDRSPKSVDRSPKSVDRPPKSVDRSPKSVDRPPNSVDRPPNSVDRSPKSVDWSPKSVESKPATKTSSTDKQPRTLKGSELQAQLAVAQEDLRKAKQQFASVEQEKIRVLEELEDAKRLADDANEKLKEAIVAQKRAEENLEIEKFRADELEQVGIDAAQEKEEEWKKELENIRNQHAVDVSKLLSITQELQRVKHDLEMATEAKNSALSHADGAMKIAEINAEKLEFLSGELDRLKSLLDSKLESVNNEAAEMVKKLDSEVDALKQELERTKAAEEKLIEMESLAEGLQIELTGAKKAESDLTKLADEWKKAAELLEVQLEESKQSEKALSDSLAPAMKQLEESNALLEHAESEIGTLKGKMESLDIEVARHKTDLDESHRRLYLAQQEALDMGKTVEVLKSKLQMVEEEKLQALNNEKDAASNIEGLTEERNKLIDEVNIARDEGEKVKKAMEGLASALHEVSTEARETQERLLTKQAEIEDAHAQIERLKSALKNTEERYEVMLDEARYEIVCLKKTVERLETESQSFSGEWEEKELNFMTAIKESDEELASLKVEMAKVVDALTGAEREAKAAKDDAVQMTTKLREADSKGTAANEAAEEAKAESLQMKESLLDKENELQSITQENDDLRIREAAALEKVKELSALLAEATAKKTEENGELSNREKDFDLLPNTSESPDVNANESEAEKMKSETPSGKLEGCWTEEPKPREANDNVDQNDEEEPLEVKMWESCKVVDKILASEREPEAESIDDDQDSKIDSGSFDQINGLSENMDNGATLPTKQQRQKKKKALLHKFGSLLKKKGNHK
ncbi:WEB family protein At3g02930, chloroplastic-like [Phoenix dactylifera]|uniref:WEB family protein At3g02930, chloroplastic-like n=1 Tax=Phoenix dactylifera TaxID=42345 RepID=A0A8B7CHM0_PHODC|nr:WEB family protein At3g02930, chloroplastic-like [Phoenix dactylifera]XP_008799394.2 WEB family protein At3g02930, chloroplastic-like [Phoenix dactylifera]XP_008799395.2 WEB family protein At3g02930, chloroplastic-like [Phoenix dactylifera]XP_008799396.2 WEB family protein At3g02930, chloroplastic-like [Phoenix dactylifera]